jgi:transcriptional regulator with XRE-family HTH domain
VEAGRAIRAARQQNGWSQRHLASVAGVDAAVVARAESGARPPSWDLVVTLLAAAGRDLQLALEPIAPDEGLRAWLSESTSQRLYWFLGGRARMTSDTRHPPWAALQRASVHRPVVLLPRASLGVWLPDEPAPVPLPIAVPARIAYGRELPEDPALEVTVGPVRLAGLVAVGVTQRFEVLVFPPEHPLMAVDPVTSARLRGVARLLDAEARRDAGRRRAAAHTDSSVLREHGFVVTRKRFKRVRSADPDPRDRRDWRLGGEASFRQWLGTRGFPLREQPDL